MNYQKIETEFTFFKNKLYFIHFFFKINHISFNFFLTNHILFNFFLKLNLKISKQNNNSILISKIQYPSGP
jgi:hypothetical protein